MAKGVLFCVCSDASEENCDKCNKYQRIKPDHTANYPAWPKEHETAASNGEAA